MFLTPFFKDDKNSGSLRKPVVCMDVMKKLTAAVRERNDPELSKELVSLCKALDVAATLSEDTVEQMIFEPISRMMPTSKSRSSESRGSLHRREQPKKLNLYSD